VKDKPKFAAYIEEHIHGKCHLFANHIIKTYPANQERQGNAPAEANHSGVVGRIGSSVVSPCELIAKLLRRHEQVCAERNHVLSKYFLSSQAKSMKADKALMQLALLKLGQWGYELFQQSLKHTGYIEHTINDDGSHTFLHRQTDYQFTLPANPTVCQCRKWVAFDGIQCSHLLLAHDSFQVDCWKERWLQRKCLDVSKETGHFMGGNPDGSADDDFSNGASELNHFSQEETGVSQADSQDALVGTSTEQEKSLSVRDAQYLASNLAFSVMRVRNPQKRNLLLGAMIQLEQIAKGNVDGMCIDELQQSLQNHLSMFTTSMSTKNRFSADGLSVPMSLGAPTGSNGGARLKSANEKSINWMRNSNKRNPSCTLCHRQGHKAGRNCPVVSDNNAVYIGNKGVEKFCNELGNPACVSVEEPGAAVKEEIRLSARQRTEIPPNVMHIVILQCYHAGKRSEHFSNNPVEILPLLDGGIRLGEGKAMYLPAHQVTTWIRVNCVANRRKKHLLSCLNESGCSQYSQECYEYDSP
jgi:hypothetical protein